MGSLLKMKFRFIKKLNCFINHGLECKQKDSILTVK